jgi:hypothetical protein
VGPTESIARSQPLLIDITASALPQSVLVLERLNRGGSLEAFDARPRPNVFILRGCVIGGGQRVQANQARTMDICLEAMLHDH